MTSGAKGWARVLVLPILLLALTAAAAEAATPLTVPELMQMLASVESARARFVETRESALLKSPLVLQGTLSYRRPDRLEKHVLTPHDERITIEGGQLTLDNRSQNRRKSVPVTAAPGLAALVESVRATRAGDLAALRRHYALQIEGTRDQWTLTLKPIESQVADYVTSIALSGSDSRIARIAIFEAGGDRSVMEITDLSGGERAPSGKTSRSLPAAPVAGSSDAPAR